jgi:hypothetical protein
MRWASSLTNGWRMRVRTVVTDTDTDTDSSRAISRGRTDSSAGNAAPASRCDSTTLLAPRDGQLPEWDGPWGSPAHGETARPPMSPWPAPGWKQSGSSWANCSHRFGDTDLSAVTVLVAVSTRWGMLLIKWGPGGPGGNHRNRMTMIHPAGREAHRRKPATAS